MNPWPTSCAPQDDELLSSWMVRLAHANGLGCESFVTHVFGVRYPIWNRDIDRSASASTLSALSKISGVEEIELTACTLEELEAAVGKSGLLPLGIYHRTRRRRGLMFCPHCLADDEMPHFRRKWRLAYLASCTRHRLVLRDACVCGAPLIPHRVDTRWKLHTNRQSNLHIRCWVCARDLRSCGAARDPDALWQISQLVEAALGESFVLASGAELYSPAFFMGLRRLMEMHVSTSGRIAPERFPLEDRARSLAMAGRWLQDWPVSFLQSMRAREASYTSVLTGRRDLPYWIDHVVRSELMVKRSNLQDDEIAAMYHYVDAASGGVSSESALSLVGHMVEKERLPARLQRRVSLESYEMLLAHLDHEIAGECAPRARAVLLADKVWIALGCVTATPIKRLATLSVADVRNLARGKAFKRARAPLTIEEVRAWLRFYLRDVRPLLGPMRETAMAFKGELRKRSVTPNALAARLRKHLVRARLDRAVPSFQALTRAVRSAQAG